jgi:uncharacterized membrane protein
MRAIAIVLMILCHGIIVTSSPVEGQSWTYFFGDHIVGDFAAPIFTFLVGVSLALSLSKAGSNKARHSYKRGFAIILIGLIYATIDQGLSGILGWDVLPFIGSSILILTVLRNQSNITLLGLALGVLLAAPFFREMIGYREIWGNRFLDVPGLGEVWPGLLLNPEGSPEKVFSLSRFFKGWLSYGYFAIFPWLVFPIIGFVVGRVGFLKDKTWNWISAGAFLFAFAGILAAYLGRSSGAEGLDHYFLTPLSFYPNTTSMIFLQMSVCLGLMTFLHKWLDRPLQTKKGLPTQAIVFFSGMSQFALTLYVSHKIILVLFKKTAPFWLQLDPEKYQGNFLTPHQGLAFSIILLLLIMGIAQLLKKSKGKLSIERWLS